MSEVGGGASRTTDIAAGTSSATDVSLREYLMQAIQDSRRECQGGIKHLEEHFDEIQKHSEQTLAEFRMDVSRRFDGVNEFRNALSDLSQLMATKDNLARVEEKFEANLSAQAARTTALERRIDLREGQISGSKITYGNIVAIAAFVATVLGIIIILSNILTH